MSRAKVTRDEESSAASGHEPDAPVYDERGNVRPHGSPGARPMSLEERVAIAESGRG